MTNNNVTGMPLIMTDHQCTACTTAKVTANNPGVAPMCTSEPLKLTHLDVCSLVSTAGQGPQYFIAFTDGFTHWICVYLMNTKSEVLAKLKLFKAEVELQTEQKVKHLWSNNSSKYTSCDFQAFLEHNSIVHELVALHTPQQNGVAERLNWMLWDMAWTMLHDTSMPAKFWPEAIKTTTYIWNHALTTLLQGKMPFNT